MEVTKSPSFYLICYFLTFQVAILSKKQMASEFFENSKDIWLLQYFLLNIFHEICICLIFLNAHKWKQRWSFRKDFNLLWVTNRTIILFCSFHLIFLSSPPWTVSKYCKTKFYHYLPFVRTRTTPLYCKRNSPDFINWISVSICCDKFSL